MKIRDRCSLLVRTRGPWLESGSLAGGQRPHPKIAKCAILRVGHPVMISGLVTVGDLLGGVMARWWAGPWDVATISCAHTTGRA